MMLSRVAERIYWAARYMERAENTARMARVYGTLLLDLPPASGVGWSHLLEMTGGSGDRPAASRAKTDRAKLRYLLADDVNPGSVLASIRYARENFRTSRDLVPREAWRAVNALYIYGRENLRRAVFERRRDEVLGTVMAQCQQIRGLLADSMNHGEAYQFLRIGRSLERADMTTRIIDVAAAFLMTGRKELEPYQNSLWITVLKSLSAYQMYRQQVRRRVVDRDVIEFLIQDVQFPRAIGYCLMEMDHSLRSLPRFETPLRGVLRMQRIIGEIDAQGVNPADLHKFIDATQLDLAQIHEQICLTWFLPEEAA